MDGDLLGVEAEDPGRVIAVEGLGLGACPDIAPVRSEIDDAVQGLHARVGEIGHFVLGGQLFGGIGQGLLGVAVLPGDGPG